MIKIIVEESGPEDFIKRISDPVWFQALGTVLAFDWNSSGLTTILTAALKEAIRGEEKELGIFIAGGKGKTSRRAPQEIQNWGEKLNLPVIQTQTLIYNSRLSAKVDNALVQDGFQIYHHAFFFSRKGTWAVVQQGMNIPSSTARRYHWFSPSLKDFVCEPHQGIISAIKQKSILNLVAQESTQTRNISAQLVQNGYYSLLKDIKILRRHSSSLSQMAAFKINNRQLTILNLENKEFNFHPVIEEDFSRSRYLEKILAKICDIKPADYEKLLAIEGVGPKTIRALALIAELLYNAPPSYEDPARYSFAFGGKDATPYPVDRKTYDETIGIMRRALNKAKIGFDEKRRILNSNRLFNF